ncbi:uncharacterized protein LOC134406668 [Elgaria multicarinata webbii]|uniref:uncharacterized protein LOC134406668 n=1 Tax=Elgaria multicarinata webbii TaxID=159646 RepID=UPI002FCD538B
MVCFAAFLVYTWALLLIAASEVSFSDPPPCVFPFIYKGKSYITCTSEGSTEQPLWCATTQNYDRDRRWKLCALKEYGGNSDGEACVFPFVYLGHTYYTCTNKFAHKGRFWCATTGSYDKDKKWRYCADTRLDVNYPVGPCVFPFTFEGKKYSGCTADGRSDGKLWCSLSRNYDVNPTWVYCDPSDPAPCSFPFTYKNKSYTSCTRDGSFDRQLWCATTPSYDKDSKWKACSLQEYGGNADGQTCVFPFTYKNQIFEACTNEDGNGRFWCATTANYDKDQKWSLCADTELKRLEVPISGSNVNPNGSCVFPFIYKSKSYTSCTTDGVATWKYWCSLTGNYDNDQKWKYCEPSGHSVPIPLGPGQRLRCFLLHERWPTHWPDGAGLASKALGGLGRSPHPAGSGVPGAYKLPAAERWSRSARAAARDPAMSRRRRVPLASSLLLLVLLIVSERAFYGVSGWWLGVARGPSGAG